MWDAHIAKVIFETVLVMAALITLIYSLDTRSKKIQTIEGCEKIKKGCLTIIEDAKVDKEVIIKLELTINQLQHELKSSKIDRAELFKHVKVAFSDIGDIKTVLSLMGAELMGKSPRLKTIENLLSRKIGD